MLRYAITSETYLAGDAARLAAAGVEFLQFRMKQAPAAEQFRAAREMMAELRGSRTKLLVNGRADVALAAGAAGIHLTAAAEELWPEQVRTMFRLAGVAPPIASVSCHTVEQAQAAVTAGADWILFGPVFEKRVRGSVVSAGLGLDQLAAAAKAAPGRVLALGGVDAVNAMACVDAGAAGVAGIRMFGGERTNVQL